MSSMVEWSTSIHVGHINLDPLILQQQTDTRRPSIITSRYEGSPPKLPLQIGIDVGMGKEDGDNRVMALVAGGEKGGNVIILLILPIDI